MGVGGLGVGLGLARYLSYTDLTETTSEEKTATQRVGNSWKDC